MSNQRDFTVTLTASQWHEVSRLLETSVGELECILTNSNLSHPILSEIRREQVAALATISRARDAMEVGR